MACVTISNGFQGFLVLVAWIGILIAGIVCISVYTDNVLIYSDRHYQVGSCLITEQQNNSVVVTYGSGWQNSTKADSQPIMPCDNCFLTIQQCYIKTKNEIDDAEEPNITFFEPQGIIIWYGIMLIISIFLFALPAVTIFYQICGSWSRLQTKLKEQQTLKTSTNTGEASGAVGYPLDIPAGASELEHTVAAVITVAKNRFAHVFDIFGFCVLTFSVSLFLRFWHFCFWIFMFTLWKNVG